MSHESEWMQIPMENLDAMLDMTTAFDWVSAQVLEMTLGGKYTPSLEFSIFRQTNSMNRKLSILIFDRNPNSQTMLRPDLCSAWNKLENNTLYSV